MCVRETALQLTNDTLCDTLQLFAERGHGLDGCPFCEYWENTTVVSTKIYHDSQLINK